MTFLGAQLVVWNVGVVWNVKSNQNAVNADEATVESDPSSERHIATG